MRRTLTFTAAVILGLAAAVPAGAATFPPRPQIATYNVTVSGTQTSTWTYSKLADVTDPCSSSGSGSGSATVKFATAKGGARIQVMESTIAALGPEPWFIFTPAGSGVPLQATFNRDASVTESGPNDPANCKAAAQGDGAKPDPDCGTRGGGSLALSFGYTPSSLEYVVDPGGPLTAPAGQILIDGVNAEFGGQPLPASYANCPFSPGVVAEAEALGDTLRATGPLAPRRLFQRGRRPIVVHASAVRDRPGGEGSVHTETTYTLTFRRVG